VPSKKLVKPAPFQYDTPPLPAVSGKKQNQILLKTSTPIELIVFDG
jgi:hypothetical protein